MISCRQVGYVQMMMGDLAAAEASFSAAASQSGTEVETMSRRNRALLLFAQRKYREAQEELEASSCPLPIALPVSIPACSQPLSIVCAFR